MAFRVVEAGSWPQQPTLPFGNLLAEQFSMSCIWKSAVQRPSHCSPCAPTVVAPDVLVPQWISPGKGQEMLTIWRPSITDAEEKAGLVAKAARRSCVRILAENVQDC